MMKFKIEINDNDATGIVVHSLQCAEEMLKKENDDVSLKTKESIKGVLHYYMIPREWEERYNEKYRII